MEGYDMMTKVEVDTIRLPSYISGYGKYTILFTLACGLCLLGITADIYAIGYILPAAEWDLKLNTGYKSLLAGAGIAGMILSANFWGFFADRYGRKRVIVYGGAGGVFCGLITALSPSFWPFVFFRCLTGAFTSGAISTIFAYSGEFLSQKHRSKSILFMGMLQNLSWIFVPALAWPLLPLNFTFSIFGYDYHSWRVFLLLNIVPLLLGTLAVSRYPESPKFLLRIGDLEATMEVLKEIYSGNNTRGNNVFPVNNVLPEVRDTTEIDQKSFLGVLKGQLALLVNRRYLSNTICTSYLQFGNFAVSGGLFIWYAEILNIQNVEQRDLTICEAIRGGRNVSSSCESHFNESIFTQNLWVGVFYIFGQLTIIFGLKYFRKTFLHGVFVGVSGVCAITMMFVTSPTFINALYVVFLVLPGLCILIVSALVVDLFPTRLRSSAVSFSFTIGRISSLVTTSIVGYLIQFNCQATFFIYAAIMISCAVVALLMRSKEGPSVISNERKNIIK